MSRAPNASIPIFQVADIFCHFLPCSINRRVIYDDGLAVNLGRETRGYYRLNEEKKCRLGSLEPNSSSSSSVSTCTGREIARWSLRLAVLTHSATPIKNNRKLLLTLEQCGVPARKLDFVPFTSSEMHAKNAATVGWQKGKPTNVRRTSYFAFNFSAEYTVALDYLIARAFIQWHCVCFPTYFIVSWPGNCDKTEMKL